MRKSRSLLLYFFIGLVVVGLATQLIKNPGQLITSMLVLLGITFIMFIVFRAIINKREGPTDPNSKKYKDAVKQSQKKYGKPVTHKQVKKSKDKNAKPKKRKRRRNSHLKVIDGHKKTNNLKENKKDSNK